MNNLENEIIEATKTVLINRINNIDKYNNPFTELARAICEFHREEFWKIIDESFCNILQSSEFKVQLREIIAQKIVRTITAESESSITRIVQKLKQDETFKAKLIVSINNLLKEYEK